MRYFSIDEFDSPDDIGSGENMDVKFLTILDEARHIAGIPFKINSGYRTRNHNKKIGGVKNSSHVNIPCNAADISTPDSKTRYAVVTSLILKGVTRIGIGKTFVHADTDETKSQEVIWHYY